MSKPLREMQAEVEQVNRDKGWYDQPVPFEQALALLHEEAAEAGHAWRDYGLADATKTPWSFNDEPGNVRLPKPEGVGSELADVLIRWLDYDARFGMTGIEYLEEDPHVFALDADFLTNICTLHGLIAEVWTAQHTCYESPASAFAAILKFVMELSADCGVNLEAEYERKLAYNRIRPYRHGNRRA
jgi:NTP pyrophosphatase (non-canonical NTP hydrolase)